MDMFANKNWIQPYTTGGFKSVWLVDPVDYNVVSQP